ANCRCTAAALRDPPSPPPAAPVPPTYIVRWFSLPRRRPPEKPPRFAVLPSKYPAKLRSSAAPSGRNALNPAQLIADSHFPSRAPYRGNLRPAIGAPAHLVPGSTRRSRVGDGASPSPTFRFHGEANGTCPPRRKSPT